MCKKIYYGIIYSVNEVNNLVYAYLGDAIYELYIREFLINKGISKVNDLQKMSLEYVTAKKQCYYVEKMLDKNFLSEEEIEIYKRGRNASSHNSKSTDIITYKKATGLECLIGYLYTKKDEKRIKEIMNFIIGGK